MKMGTIIKKGREAVEHPTTRDIAWLAGLYEGEGWCERNKTGCPTVQIGQRKRWILDRCRRLFGGIVIRMKTPLGKPYYRWFTSGARARGILMTIYIFLSPHRKKVIRSALA